MQSIQQQGLKLLFALLIALFSGVSSGVTVAQSVQIIPVAPRYHEPVYVRIKPTISECIYAAQVTMVGTVISVQYQRFIELCGYDYDVELGRFPAGTYTVNVQNQAPVQFTVSGSISSPPTTYPGNQPTVDYSGLWWSPAESGWGLSIAQGATNKLFAVWFVYGPSGEPIWYTLEPGNWTSSAAFTTYTGPIYKTTGPYFGNIFNPVLVGARQVGTGTLSFRYFNKGTLQYTVDGIQGTKNVERLIIE